MAITTSVVTVGTAGATLASPTIDTQAVWIENLEPNTQYGFRFRDVGGNGTNVHAVIGWVEKYNGLNDVYLSGAIGESVRLRGGEKIQLELEQGEGITATASREGVQVAVMRQD